MPLPSGALRGPLFYEHRDGTPTEPKDGSPKPKADDSDSEGKADAPPSLMPDPLAAIDVDNR